MAYEVVMPYHLHMPSYFLETFTEYPFIGISLPIECIIGLFLFFLIHILFFAYICLQISRLVGLFGIEEPKQKVEFQNRDVPLCLYYSIFR